MTVPILPETAPFSPTQRAWLNGFFAGLLGMDGAPASQSITALPHLLNTGMPETPVQQAPAEEFPWHDAALPLEERLQLAEGKPLERVMMAAMAQLDCGTCGYLCQTYAEAVARGEETDLSLCTPGGRETMRKLKELSAVPRAGSGPALPMLQPAAPRPNGSAANGAAGIGSRKHPVPARLVDAAPLTRPGSGKNVRHIALDLADSGLSYEVGDALGVYPENCPELTEAVLTALRATGDEPVALADAPSLAAREALAQRCFRAGSGELLPLLAGWAADPTEARRLRALAEDDSEGFLDGHDLLDLLHLFPSARGPVSELVAALPPLQPRLYSIASSPKANPGQVHLTVGVVRYGREGCSRTRKGVASTFLGERAARGAEVKVFRQPAHGFRLPADGGTPVIMVGPGTGIAPFRAFLQERGAVGARGKNWLFFGDQRRDTDFLYREELERFHTGGLLTRLDLAFSRDQAEKVYVQHRMRESAAELWKWLREGAHFYVCGDAQRMARDVDATLHHIVAEQGRLSEVDAKAYVGGLKRDGRYQRDVY